MCRSRPWRSGTLTVTSPAPAAHIPAGLDRLRDLRQIGEGTVDAAPLSVLRHLESLWLAWHGAPGDLTDAAVLGELPRLARVTLTDAYGIDADTLPDLPALTGLTIHGLRRTAATGIKARYRRTPVHLSITGAKNDTWLAANLTNPLRDWADDIHARRGRVQGIRDGRSSGRRRTRRRGRPRRGRRADPA